MTDFTQGEDVLDVGRRPVWYRTVDLDGDGADDATVIYDNAGGEGGIVVVLRGLCRQSQPVGF